MEASPHCPVRLECVMHAASVHPEPGSNSRQFSIITCFLHVITKPEFPFASFEFSRSFLPSCVLLGIVEILLCLVVQFSRTISLSLHLSFLLPSLSKAPHRTAWLFYHISYPFVNPFLKKKIFLLSNFLKSLYSFPKYIIFIFNFVKFWPLFDCRLLKV